jgi:hypothetical protein
MIGQTSFRKMSAKTDPSLQPWVQELTLALSEKDPPATTVPTFLPWRQRHAPVVMAGAIPRFTAHRPNAISLLALHDLDSHGNSRQVELAARSGLA